MTLKKDYPIIYCGFLALLACILPGHLIYIDPVLGMQWYLGFQMLYAIGYGGASITWFYFDIIYGIIGIIALLVGIIAIITGFMAKKRDKSKEMGTLWTIMGIMIIAIPLLFYFYEMVNIGIFIIPLGPLILAIAGYKMIKVGTSIDNS